MAAVDVDGGDEAAGIEGGGDGLPAARREGSEAGRAGFIAGPWVRKTENAAGQEARVTRLEAGREPCVT